jgi:hypothetical protein
MLAPTQTLSEAGVFACTELVVQLTASAVQAPLNPQRGEHCMLSVYKWLFIFLSKLAFLQDRHSCRG